MIIIIFKEIMMMIIFTKMIIIIFTKMIISTSWEPSSSFEMRRGLAGSRGGDTSVLGQHKDDDQDQNEDRGIKIKFRMNCSFEIKRWG